MNYQCYDNFWYDPYPTYADCGGDDYNHMFTDALHSSVVPTFSTPKNEELQYRAANPPADPTDPNQSKWFHPVGSNWYADDTGNLYNSKGKMVNYHSDPMTGKMVFTNNSGVTRYLPTSAVRYLVAKSKETGVYTSALNNLPGQGMNVILPANKRG